MTRTIPVTFALATAVAIAAVVLGATSRGEAASQMVPANVSAPTIAGQAVVGEILTASRGTWTGTEPIGYAYQWQRCDQKGAACSNIANATQQSYTVPTAESNGTLRVQVTATNADGSASASSAPTSEVEAAQSNITGCPPVQEAGPLTLDQIKPPARLVVDRTSITPRVITRSTQSITLRFHVVACDARRVVGALVHATPTPFQQFAETERPTGADGWATLTMRRLRFFPVSGRQQLLVVFVRARKPGEELLGGISSRRPVAFPVRLG